MVRFVSFILIDLKLDTYIPEKCSRYTFVSATLIKFRDSTTSFKHRKKEHDQRKTKKNEFA